MKKEVLVQSAEASAIREKLSSGELPCAIDDIDQPSLALLLRQCWHSEPLLRPTAADIARTLLEISMASIKDKTEKQSHPEATTQDDTSISETSEISMLESKLLKYIQEARVRYANKNTNPPTDKVTFEEFRVFVDDSHSWEAAKYFLVGAAILWDLVDGELENLIGTDAVLTMSRFEKGKPKQLHPFTQE
jgi:hypothetical protein